VDELSKEGAQVAGSAQEVASRSEVVITMLPDSPDVELVYAGERGVFVGVKSGALLIDMSSISPVVARKLAAQAKTLGCDMIDAPVSGGEAGAIAPRRRSRRRRSAVERCRSFRRWGNIVHDGATPAPGR
jgi:2-hydroxy-3-oxopropionate reductase